MIKEIESLFTAGEPLHAPISLYSFQKEIIDLLEKNNKVMVVKSRQMGITETALLWSLTKCIKNPSYFVIYMSANSDSSTSAHSKAKGLLAKTCDLQLKYETDNNAIAFENGSRIAFIDNEIYLRGLAGHAVIMDEMAFHNDGEKILSTIINLFSGPENKILFFSSPSPSGKFFHNEYRKNLEGKSEFVFYKAMWFLNPIYNITESYVDWQDNPWAVKMKDAMGDLFRQEILCEFSDKPYQSHKKQMFNFRIERHLMNKFKICAEMEGRNYSEILRNLIIDYIYKKES